ncbi:MULTISPECIES: hypothetical protein [unclassified Micromonospora]|uniref:hypothetical protein n=1 Tax=unclassified Micromonospora TaxID=2617518 RepID=UPI0033210553
MTVNIASDGDRAAVQVGYVGGSSERRERAEVPPEPGDVQVENIREGNARVGMQADVIVGDLRIG